MRCRVLFRRWQHAPRGPGAAIAGRVGYDIDLKGLDRMGRDTPVLVDLKPSGKHYMEDFHKAGGVPALLRTLKPLLRLDALTITGRTLGEEEAVGVEIFAPVREDYLDMAEHQLAYERGETPAPSQPRIEGSLSG